MLVWVPLIFVSGLLIALANIGLKMSTVKSIGMVPISIYFFSVAIGVASYGVYRSGWGSVAANLSSPEGIKYAALAGVAGVASNILLYTALVQAPAGLGFTVYNVTSTIATAGLGVLLLKEVITPVQAVGIALALLGVVLITWRG